MIDSMKTYLKNLYLKHGGIESSITLIRNTPIRVESQYRIIESKSIGVVFIDNMRS